MVEMRVRQNDRINLLRRNRQFLPVAFAPFLLPLEQPAIDQHLNSLLAVAVERSVDEVLGTSHSPSRAEKLDVGQREVSSE